MPRIPGSGRQKGSKNKTPNEVRQLALSFCPEAIRILIAIARKTSADDTARVAATRVLLDRGLGKAVQPVGGLPDPLTGEHTSLNASPGRLVIELLDRLPPAEAEAGASSTA